MAIPAYPLSWPLGFPRAKSREKGKFQTTLAGALKNVEGSLKLFASDSGKKLENLVISSNVTLGQMNPSDPGVSVWFSWDGMEVCIAVDRYLKVEANLQAIHHIIEARRVELRHGTLALVRASFTGFKAALPAPGKREWYTVLGTDMGASKEVVDKAYKALASKFHPDRSGGDAEKMVEINEAYAEAKAALSQ